MNEEEINLRNIFFGVINDELLRFIVFIVLAVILRSYQIFGFIGSLFFFISFLSGVFLYYKYFYVHKCIIPDLTKIFWFNNNLHQFSIDHGKKQLVRQNTSDPGCRVCGDVFCVRDKSPTHITKPWEELTIPANINQALENLLIKLINRYINSWYKNISNEIQFQTELKSTIRYSSSILIHRIRKINLSEFLLYRILPIITNHIITIEKYKLNGGNNGENNENIKWHCTLKSRNTELKYLRCITKQLLPILLPQSYNNCKMFNLLIREIISGWILLPMNDSIANPTMLNIFLYYIITSVNETSVINNNKTPNLDNKTSESLLNDILTPVESMRAECDHSNTILNKDNRIPSSSSLTEIKSEGNSESQEKPESPKNNFEETLDKDFNSKEWKDMCEEISKKDILEKDNISKDIKETHNEMATEVFCDLDKNATFLENLWHPSLELILKNQNLLLSFMQYLKSQSDINILQFCLDIEEFNSRMLAPDLSSDELDMLYKDAWDLYSIYFSPHSPNSIDFDPKLCQQLRKILSKDVSKLRTSSPLFQAYEFAYNRLEKTHVGNFHKSEEFFICLCGPKISSNNSSGLNSPESLDSPFKKKKSPTEGPVSKFSNKLQKIAGVLKPNLVLEGQKDTDISIESEIEMAESVEEERDLSKWKVSVFNSRIKTNPNFTVKVVRTDLNKDDPDSEWTVYRKINDFYNLENKLTEFHGNFSDIQLPTKKLLTPLPDDSRIYESYIRNLLSVPLLKGSDLLFDFLTASTFEVEQFGLSKLLRKSVPITLKKERGQNLDIFIKNFLESTKNKTGGKIEWTDINEEIKPRYKINNESKIYGNNLNQDTAHAQNEDTHAEEEDEEEIEAINFQFNTNLNSSIFEGPVNCLFYFGLKSYNLSGALLRLIFVILSLFKTTLESLVLICVTRFLTSVLSSTNIAYVIYLLEWSLFENTAVVDPIEAKVSVEKKIENTSIWIKPLYRQLFNMLQEPLLNKQLYYHLLEEVLAELFPELLLQTQKSPPSSPTSSSEQATNFDSETSI